MGILPAEIKENGHFCCWRYEECNSKKTKIPYNPLTGRIAKSNDINSFTNFETAVHASGYNGIGAAFLTGYAPLILITA